MIFFGKTARTRRDVLQRVLALAGAAMVPGIASAGPTVHRIEIKRFKYDPAVLQVRAGDKIIWTNHDIAPHTATADDESWDTGELAKGDSAEVTVSADMFGSYFCRYHPHMKAKVQLDA